MNSENFTLPKENTYVKFDNERSSDVKNYQIPIMEKLDEDNLQSPDIRLENEKSVVINKIYQQNFQYLSSYLNKDYTPLRKRKVSFSIKRKQEALHHGRVYDYSIKESNTESLNQSGFGIGKGNFNEIFYKILRSEVIN